MLTAPLSRSQTPFLFLQVFLSLFPRVHGETTFETCFAGSTLSHQKTKFGVRQSLLFLCGLHTSVKIGLPSRRSLFDFPFWFSTLIRKATLFLCVEVLIITAMFRFPDMPKTKFARLSQSSHHPSLLHVCRPPVPALRKTFVMVA